MAGLPVAPKGSQFSVTSGSSPDYISIAGLANGETAVAWQDGSNAAVQLFSSNGVAVSGEIIPVFSGNSETLSNQKVVALANGNFVVAWEDNVDLGNGNGQLTIDAQIYDPTGNKVGGEITVIPTLAFSHISFIAGNDLFATPDGGFADAESFFSANALVQAFHADGTKNGAELSEGGATANLFGATALTSGDVVSLFGAPDEFFVYDPSGNQIVGATDVLTQTMTEGDVAALPDGRFVVVFLKQATGGQTVEAEGYNSNGTTFLDEIGINNTAINTEVNGGNPHVAVMPDGRFIVSWYDTSGDAGNDLTEGRVFNPNGNAASDVFVIPGSSESSSEFNDVTALSNTSFAVDWNTGSTIKGLVLTIQAPPDVADNFVGYGTSDVLLQSGSSVIDWIVSNGSFASYNPIGNAGGYGIVGTGDFNGDGTTDLLLENGSGSVIDWIMQNGAYQSYNNIGSPGGYGVVGTGDYNGDGTNDVLLENGSGNVIDWTMQNGNYAGWNQVGSTTGYGIVGKGDFNGDGTTDILLQGPSGNLIDWAMNNGTYAGYNSIGNPGAAGYGVVGTGDFNGDGTTDLLLENGSGNIIDWIIQNGSYASWNEVGNASGYGVVATGDYNRDGTTDILLENAGSNTIDWTIRNATFLGWKGVGNALGYGVNHA